MNAELITTIVVTVLLAVLGILVLIGKGDWAISGYNTASAEERAQYNIRRLRLVIGLTSVAVAFFVALSIFLKVEWILFVTVLPATLLALILSNTWAKN